MPTPERAIDAVAEDVAAGFEERFRPDPDLDKPGFRVLEPYDVEQETFVNDTRGTAAVAVPWAWKGRFDEPFVTPYGTLRPRTPAEAREGASRLSPEVEIRGVTIVRDDPEKGEQFQRFVDWLGVLSSMGVALVTRPVIDSVEADTDDLSPFEPLADDS